MLDTLGLLPEPARRLRSFISSLVLNVSIGALLLWFTVTRLHNSPAPPRYITTELIFPSKLPPLHKKQPAPHSVAELPRKIETQLPKPAPVKPEVVHMETPAMPTMPSVPAATVAAPAQPKVGSFASAKQSTLATNAPAPAIKTGGFGDPFGSGGESKCIAAGNHCSNRQVRKRSGYGTRSSLSPRRRGGNRWIWFRTR